MEENHWEEGEQEQGICHTRQDSDKSMQEQATSIVSPSYGRLHVTKADLTDECYRLLAADPGEGSTRKEELCSTYHDAETAGGEGRAPGAEDEKIET